MFLTYTIGTVIYSKSGGLNESLPLNNYHRRSVFTDFSSHTRQHFYYSYLLLNKSSDVIPIDSAISTNL